MTLALLTSFLWVLACVTSLVNLGLVIRHGRRQKRQLAVWVAETDRKLDELDLTYTFFDEDTP